MADSYWVGYCTSEQMNNIAQYVEDSLAGVSQDRIVSITHAHSMNGPYKGYSVMIVLMRPRELPERSEF